MQSRSSSNSQGIDVSHWQGSINWSKVKASGKQYVFIKATEGSSYRDNQFITNVKGARAAGLLVGAYHFINATTVTAARQEATHFVTALNEVGGVSSFDLPPVMDYENNPGNLSKSGINAVALAFLQEVEQQGGRKPIVYTGNAFAQHFDASLGAYDLWIARYSNTRVPDDCAAWKEWDFWQYTDSGQVDGISGGVDLNAYRGTLEQLKARYTKTNTEQGGNQPMTAEEQKAFAALQATVKAQADRIAALTDSRDLLKTSLSKIDSRVQSVENSHAMDVPEWAEEAVKKAVSAGIIHNPDSGSYDFYRLLTVLDRKGLI
ncbi:glycoside hydrolase family 25 protein [Paenibacillus kandeliae]|uniref:glycoside hydrolase family 25 protein n=1 Tax=Paenibacillus kandeliae TaxID=3231269 RepID=UPI003459BCE9